MNSHSKHLPIALPGVLCVTPSFQDAGHLLKEPALGMSAQLTLPLPPPFKFIHVSIVFPAQEAFSSVVIPPHSLSPHHLFLGHFFHLASHKSFCFLSPCHSVSPEQTLLSTSQHFGCICSLVNAQPIILNRWGHVKKLRHSVLDNLPVTSLKKMKLCFCFPLYLIGLTITSCLHHSPLHEGSSEKCLFSIIFVRSVSWYLGIKIKNPK